MTATTPAEPNQPRTPEAFGRARVHLATPGAMDLLREYPDPGAAAAGFVARHYAGDFGTVSQDDRRANFDAIQNGARILSCYPTPNGDLWIITEAMDDEGVRHATTMLTPDEY